MTELTRDQKLGLVIEMRAAVREMDSQSLAEPSDQEQDSARASNPVSKTDPRFRPARDRVRDAEKALRLAGAPDSQESLAAWVGLSEKAIDFALGMFISGGAHGRIA
jgi:hypothetical protein